MSANKYLSAIQKETTRKKVPSSVANDWKSVMREMHEMNVDEVPKGWNTLDDICELMGVSEMTARRVINAAINAGKADMRKFKIMCSNRALPIPHYKLRKQ